MATLYKLGLSETATAAEVTGAGGTGNDQQLKTLLLAVRNRHKKSPWSSHYSMNKIEITASSDTEYYPRVIMGYAEVGMWIKNVFIHVTECRSTSEAVTNVVTAQMFKTTSLVSGSSLVASTDLPPTSGYVDIIPPVDIRSIRGLDDRVHSPLPIEMDYIAAGEYWYLLFTPPSDTNMGWEDADVLIHFAELHRT